MTTFLGAGASACFLAPQTCLSITSEPDAAARIREGGFRRDVSTSDVSLIEDEPDEPDASDASDAGSDSTSDDTSDADHDGG